MNISYFISRTLKKLRGRSVQSSQIDQLSRVESGTQVVDSKMDAYSYCGYDCTILNAEIGKFCSISDHVYIGGAGHPMHFVSTSPIFLSHRDALRRKFAKHTFSHMPRTVVGHDVWIGHGAKVRAGVHVGHGAVIGMGAVVSRDVAPYDVVAGNPARVVNHRFQPEIVAALLKSEWWNMEGAELREWAKLFDNPVLFLKKRGLI